LGSCHACGVNREGGLPPPGAIVEKRPLGAKGKKRGGKRSGVNFHSIQGKGGRLTIRKQNPRYREISTLQPPPPTIKKKIPGGESKKKKSPLSKPSKGDAAGVLANEFDENETPGQGGGKKHTPVESKSYRERPGGIKA